MVGVRWDDGKQIEHEVPVGDDAVGHTTSKVRYLPR